MTCMLFQVGLNADVLTISHKSVEIGFDALVPLFWTIDFRSLCIVIVSTLLAV